MRSTIRFWRLRARSCASLARAGFGSSRTGGGPAAPAARRAVTARVAAGVDPFDGLLGVAVGVVVFVWPALSALGLLYAVAAWAIATGILEMSVALVVPISGGRRLLLLLGGLFSVAFGVIMFGHPGAGAVALLALIGAFAFVSGVMQIAFAMELRSVAWELERYVRPLTKPRTAAHA